MDYEEDVKHHLGNVKKRGLERGKKLMSGKTHTKIIYVLTDDDFKEEFGKELL